MNGDEVYVDAEKLVVALPKNHLKPFALIRWYLSNLLKTFRWAKPNGTNGELCWAAPPGSDGYRLTPSTVVHVFSTECSVVFVLDCSMSATVASADKNCVILDRVYAAFHDALLKLTKPIRAFKHRGICCPRFRITVVAYSSLYCIPGGQVLLQDVSVDSTNVAYLLIDLSRRFKAYLSCLAEVAKSKLKCDPLQEDLSVRSVSPNSTGSLHTQDVVSFADELSLIPELLGRSSYEEDERSTSTSEAADVPEQHRSLVTKTEDFCLFDIVQLALLTVSDCSDDGPYHLFVITDGVLDLSSNDDLQCLLTRLHLLNITDGGYESHQAFGRTPSSELLQFVAKVTQGRYFLYSSQMKESDIDYLNEYQQAAFTVSIPVSTVANNVATRKLGTRGRFSRTRRLQYNHTVEAGMLSVLDARLQEGYHVKGVDLSSSTIRINLIRAWKYEVDFFFSITGAWPVDERNVSVKWKIEAPSCMFPPLIPKFATKWPVSNSGDGEFATSNAKHLVSNRLPVMLTLLDREAMYMTIPEPLKLGLQFNGIQLPPNAVTPEPIHKMNSRPGRSFKTPVVCNLEAIRSMEKFRIYWTNLISLSPVLRRKVFHVDRLNFVLNHESSALNSSLYPCDDSDYSVVCFDESRAAVEDFFLRFSSFSLTKTSCYVKFRTGDSEPADAFCIIRVIMEEPLVTVELNFSSSFHELERRKLVQDLRMKLSNLQLFRCSVSTASSVHSNENVDTLMAQKAMSSAFVPACFLIDAPLDRLAIRHTSLPVNPLTPFHPNELDEQPLCSGLCRFMKFRRYWWSLKLPGTVYQMEMEVANLILHALLHKRLNSGFRVIYSKGGFTTLLKEHKEQDDGVYGLIQYVVYPTVLTDAHFDDAICKSRMNSSTEIHCSLTEDAYVTLSEVQICTEVWITPGIDNMSTSSIEDRPSEKLFESCPLIADSVRSSAVPPIGHRQGELEVMVFAANRSLPDLLLPARFVGFIRPSDQAAEEDNEGEEQQIYDEDVVFLTSLITVEQLKALCHETARPHVLNEKEEYFVYPSCAATLPQFRCDEQDEKGYGPCSVTKCVVFNRNCFSLHHLLRSCRLVTMLFSTIIVAGDDGNEKYAEANSLVFQVFHHTLAKKHTNWVLIKQSNKLYHLWNLIVHRLQECDHPPIGWLSIMMKRLSRYHDARPISPLYEVRLPKLVCFIRQIGAHHRMLLLSPATFQDVRLLYCDSSRKESINFAALPENSVNNHGVLSFPLFVIDCCRETILFNLVNGIYPGEYCLDAVEDLRSTMSPEESTLTLLHRQISQFSADTVSSFERGIVLSVGEEPCCDCIEDFNFVQYGRQIEDAYGYSIVAGIYVVSGVHLWALTYCFLLEALKNELLVHSVDLRFAIDCQCEESTVEIDITEFVNTLCNHVKTYKQTNPSDATSDGANTWIGMQGSTEDIPLLFRGPPCNSVRQAYTKRLFNRVVRQHFRPVTDYPDYFVCFPDEESFDSTPSMNVAQRQGATNLAHRRNADVLLFRRSRNANLQAVDFATLSADDDATTSELFPPCDLDDSGMVETRFDSTLTGDSLSMSSCETSFATFDSTYPVFLQITCSVFIAGRQYNFSTFELPTCLNDLFRKVGVVSWADLSSVRVILEFNVLAPPSDNGEDINVGCFSETTSLCFEELESNANGVQVDYGRVFVGAHYQLATLPLSYKSSLEKLYSQAFILVRNEIIFAYKRLPTIDVAIIEIVVNHIRSISKHVIANELSALTETIPLVFVLHERDSLEDFLKRLKKVRISHYLLNQFSDNYLIVTVDSKFIDARRIRRLSSMLHDRPKCHELSAFDGSWSVRHGGLRRSHSFSEIPSKLLAQRNCLLGSFEEPPVFGHHSKENLLSGSTFATLWSSTYEKDRLELASGTLFSARAPHATSEESVAACAAMSNEDANLSDQNIEFESDFWLILCIKGMVLEMFFQERKPGFHDSLVNDVLEAIKATVKMTNQKMLLQHLYQTRFCHHLLVEARDGTLWNEGSSDIVEDLACLDTEEEVGYLAASSQFRPGYFACPCVAYRWFRIHPRLKQGAERTGTSLVLGAVRTILNKFAVFNHQSVFVYKDSNDCIFYMRLHEEIDKSVIKLIQRCKCTSDKDQSSIGGELRRVLSNLDNASQVNNEFVLLTVHGIDEPGREIFEEFFPALQSRIDESILDVLLLAFSRNPNLRFTLEDIRFLQPVGSTPHYLHFSLPSVAILHLYPFSYYLSQHLSAFMDAPKYVSPDAKFTTELIKSGNAPLEAAQDIITYIYRPGEDRKGLSVVCQAFVNQIGTPTAIVHYDPIDQKGGYNSFFNSMYSFDQLISAHRCHLEAFGAKNIKKSRKRMVMAQFVVWRRGTVDMDTLESLILTAISRACFDMVTEYGLLTAALFHTDPSKMEMMSLSEPGSPTDKQIRERHSSFAARMALRSPFERSSIFSFENFQMLMKKSDSPEELPKKKEVSFGEMRNKSEYPQCLGSVYADTAVQWLDFGSFKNCSSVRRIVFMLQSNLSRGALVEECREIIQRMVGQDIKCFAFVKRNHDASSEKYSSWYYTENSSVDLLKRADGDQCEFSKASFLIVGLPLVLWKETMMFARASSCEEVPGSISELVRRGEETKQKYPPFIADKRLDCNWGFIPRQRLVLFSLNAYELRLYAYNWVSDFNETLEKMIKASVHRYNSRIHLLQQICLEKMGLPRNAIGDYCTESCLQNIWQNPELYVSAKRSLDNLNASGSNDSHHRVEGLYHDDSGCLWSEVKPIEAFTSGDIAQAYIEQMIHIKNIKLEEELFARDCMSLAKEWSDGNAKTPHVFEESFLQRLCNKSHLVHMVFTPVMFDPRWRENLAFIRTPSSSNIHANTALTSLHSTLRTRVTTASAFCLSETFDSTEARTFDHWHIHLQHTMLEQFNEYLYSLNLQLAKIRVKKNSDPSGTRKGSSSPSAWFLRRCTDGFMVVHFYFSQPYFGGHFFAFPASLIDMPISDGVGKRLSELCRCFIIECHVHSFAYDFHLRIVSSHVSGEKNANFCPGYNLRSFLRDFSLYYACRPLFARTYFFEEELCLSELRSPPDELYRYLLDKATIYGLKAVKIHSSVSRGSSTDENADRVLAYQSAVPIQLPVNQEQSQQDSRKSEYDAHHLVLRKGDSFLSRSGSAKTPIRDWLRVEIYSIFIDKSSTHPHETKTVEGGRYERVRKYSFFEKIEDELGWTIRMRNHTGEPSEVVPMRRALSQEELAVEKSTLKKSLSFAVSALESCVRRRTVSTSMAHEGQEGSCRARSESHSLTKVSILNSNKVQQSSSYSMSASPKKQQEAGDDTYEHVSLRPEQVNYLTFIPEAYTEMQKLLLNEGNSFKSSLRLTIQEASSQCYLDSLWQKLLYDIPVKGPLRRDQVMTITFSEFETLLHSTRLVPFLAIDPRISFMLTFSPSRIVPLMRCVQQRFADNSRYICSDDSRKQYLVVINQDKLDCFLVISADFADRTSGVSMCYKNEHADIAEQTPKSRDMVNGFLEEFINTAAFHFWTQLLPY
ncbi:hypothetical protein M514_04639 [Trichuris suis]|uniref:Ig-like domain-containing protein n=1 Tax=Trichuris suis TaxID=68888 RepID=A0A085NV62_9BILA|nr:hypothetical protein M514_04639 [Trichuris suis]